jgi:hypothetical protein
MTWRCNGIAECANGEDEKLCGKLLYFHIYLLNISALNLVGKNRVTGKSHKMNCMLSSL